jgi:hypothetical protein
MVTVQYHHANEALALRAVAASTIGLGKLHFPSQTLLHSLQNDVLTSNDTANYPPKYPSSKLLQQPWQTHVPL